MEEDKYLWNRFRNNESSALSHIYNQNVDFLFFYGKKFTGEEDFILDIIQDLFCDLIKYRKKIGETDNIRLYLMKSFRRNLLRKLESKRRLLNIDNDYITSPEIVFSVEDEIIRDEDLSRRMKMVKQGLKALNAKQREVIYYKFTLGYDYPQICELMSISYDSARQSVSRGIISLKQYMLENNFILLLIQTKFKKS